MKDVITYPEFAKMDMRIGKVLSCVEKEGSEKLLKLSVSFGDEGERTIFTGIKEWYTAVDLVGKQFLFIINLQPRKMMDEYSEGMILMADGEKPVALVPTEDVAEGAAIT